MIQNKILLKDTADRSTALIASLIDTNLNVNPR